MNDRYLKALYRLESYKTDIDSILHEIQNDTILTFEDRQVGILLESLIESINDTHKKIKKFSKHAKEGFLKEIHNKFEFITDKGMGLGWLFACGDPLEVWDNDLNEWFIGRVEYTDGKYYFSNAELGNPSLYNGMKVRLRMEDTLDEVV